MLAIVMGVPRESNHLYAYIFRPEIVPATFGIGMGLRVAVRTNYDCNTQMVH